MIAIESHINIPGRIVVNNTEMIVSTNLHSSTGQKQQTDKKIAKKFRFSGINNSDYFGELIGWILKFTIHNENRIACNSGHTSKTISG